MAATGGVAVAPRFPVLDALRALGALAVLTTHVGFYAGSYVGQGTWGSFLARLDIGVALFFVLSGFLLSRPYLARAALARPRPDTGHYLWKRFLRIAPVYAVAVVLALLLLEQNDGLGARDWLVTLTLTNTFLDPLPPDGLSQMWSLAVEVSFYLVLPLLMLAATGRRARALSARRVVVVLTVLVVLSCWWHLDGAARSEGLTDGPALQWLPAYLGWFAVGIGLALAHVVQQTDRPSRLAARVLALGREPGVCWTLVAGLLLVATTPVAGPTLLEPATPAESLTKSLLYGAVGGLVVLTGIGAGPDPAGPEGTGPRSWYARVLGSSPARHLGVTSYSLFCLHLMLLDLLAPALGYTLFGGHFLELWLITVVASLVAAEIAYRLVELPALRLKERRPLRRGRRPVAATTGSATSGTKDR